MRKVSMVIRITKFVEDLDEARTVADNAAKLMDQAILTAREETVTVERITDEGETEVPEEEPEE